jgi:hypothetical protein
MNSLASFILWSIYAVLVFFMFAYMAFWALFAFSAEWFGGLVVAIALAFGGFKAVRNLTS